jgi:acetolactate synthase-1/2/3 large subunit
LNGGQALIRTLVNSSVDVCFMNPGTSEMHFVAALDDVPEMRGVLGLFEGAVTGAADGYARMADKPAATLLHLGPGLGNGVANLHNARKAKTPIVNIVGDHATYHKQYDAQLESDIEAIARNVSPGFVRWCKEPAHVGEDAVETVRAAYGPPGQVATLILPADVSWTDGATPAAGAVPPTRREPSSENVELVAKALRSGEPTGILIGGSACRRDALELVSRLSAATGCKVLCETFPARLERGAGIPGVERIAYLAEFAMTQLDGLAHLVLIDAKAPVSFFAYPEKPSYLVPNGCEVHVLADPSEDAIRALEALCDAVGASGPGAVAEAARPGRPSGALTAQTACEALGALLPEGAIVSDEGNTSGLYASRATDGASPHDWLCLTGGAIGQGLPVAVGAAVACPDRRVVSLEADGSAMYTFQSLWTAAREGLDITTIVFANRSYAVLNMELNRVGASSGGAKAKEMLDISRPEIDFVSLAKGVGVPAVRPDDAGSFYDALAEALRTPGPSLIEAVIPSFM